MDIITVWMSSPNDEVPAVAKRGATRVARGGQSSGRSRAALEAAWALVYPRVGGGARGGSRGPIGIRPIIEINLGLSDIPIVGRMLLETIPQEGFSPDSRYRRHSLVNVGPNISRSAGPHDSWPAWPYNWRWLHWTSFLVQGLYSDPRGTHHVQIVENILGFLGPGKDGEN
ncbi:hypothetical protein EVAR_85049_1 [Eumeta japonica]|uniref:Uncharacterized protein n=1 Tax=Eumeta variegata TaxID=151549 RepID=A0A4C1SBU5_EUMVA|nr:hypothetical protein EVAR_85049_1 [Eumeta japonica]